MWWLKFFISVIIDFLDFTIGRLMFATPFMGELFGVFVGFLMFGSRAFVYALEGIDITEQIDGFIPTASIIALNAKDAQPA